MKAPMTAEEYFRLYYSTHLDNNNDRMCYAVDCYDAIQEYSTYLLNHHLERFANQCKLNGFANVEYNYRGEPYASIDFESIDQTLNDYKLKNNIK